MLIFPCLFRRNKSSEIYTIPVNSTIYRDIFCHIPIHGLIIANIQRFSSTIAFEWGVLYQALITAIVWPWFQLILGELRRLLTNRV